MAEIVTIAEKALLARQKLPEAFGNHAVRPSYDGLGLANIAALVPHWLCPQALNLSEQTSLPPFNPDLLDVLALTEAWKTWLSQAPINHVVLLLVDALGYDQLRTLMDEGDAPGLALRDHLQANSNKGKTFTFVYIPNIDSAAHRYGPLSSCYRAEVAALDFSLQRELLSPMAGRADTILLLVADHGQRYAYPDKILWLNQHPSLTQLLFVPATGESQARFLHLVRDAEADAIDYVQQHLAENFLVLSKAEAIELGLFGIPGQPLSVECYNRVGDLILIPRNDWACFYEEHNPTQVGIHGGMSRAEMLIPFLAYRF